MNHRNTARLALLAAAVLPLTATLASAQYRVDTGAANDANNRLGSGGYNDGTNIVNNRVGGLAGNYIVTGNVTGGRAFRGNVGYTDTTGFRGNLGSANFDNFIRDSTGVGQVRGNYNRNPNANPQPFFGAGRTVAPPPGFIRDQTNSGTFIPAANPGVSPNDGRIDFGGASRSQLTQAILGSQQVYGNASGIAPTSGQQFAGAYPNANDPVLLSEYTSLARQRRGLFDQSGSSATGVNDLNARPLDAARLDAQNAPGVAPTPTLPRPGAQAGDAPDNRINSSAPLEFRPEAADGAPTNPADTGQGSPRTRRALENNPQYAALRERFDQARRDRADAPRPGTVVRVPNDETAGQPIAGGVQPSGADGGVSTGQGRTPEAVLRPPTKTPAADEKPADAAAGTDATRATDATKGAGDSPVAPDGGIAPAGTGRLEPSGPAVPNATPRDNLQLPRPEGSVAAATPRANNGAPVRITSLATGVAEPQLAKVLTQAESLMKAGKFGSAIEAYGQAEDLAGDDPLVFMGRSIAELGGGFYRKAEDHLRQAFAADEALLYAKFDLRGLLGDERLNTLIADLNEVARTNETDPGPLLMAGFIYYNAGMEQQAARALDLAQTRANGKDRAVDLLRQNWNFDASSDAQNK